jgi:Flp pilus assembly protein TadG
LTAFSRPLAAAARCFLGDASGVAAVEMAFIAPVAITLLFVGFAGGQTLNLNHKVVLAAHSTTDLVARSIYIQDSNNPKAELLAQSALDADIAFSQLIMYPDANGTLTEVMSELQVNKGNNTGVVVWSRPSPGATALPIGTVVTLDPSYSATGADYLLYGQVTYTFQPLGGLLSLPPITLSSTETLTIRNAPQIDIDPNS